MHVSTTVTYEELVRIQELIKLLGLKSIRFESVFNVFGKYQIAYTCEVSDSNRISYFMQKNTPKPLSRFDKLVRNIKRMFNLGEFNIKGNLV